jgi:hypothetical protein
VSKIAFIGGEAPVTALLAAVAEQPELEAVVMVCRRAGRWQACWSSGLTAGGLSLAALMLLDAVQGAVCDEGEGDEG